MRIVRTVTDLRAAVDRSGTVGLVPTMGAFHAGHLELIRAARADTGFVVVSLFVNPTQFNERADLAAYPRDEARDARLAEAEGADLMFAPPVEEVYPDGFATALTLGGIGDRLEGEHRPGHFAGVATVVTKLFNMVQPDVAYFGQKDAQQAALIRRLVRDLDMPVQIDVRPTVREPDGLAMSSRNVRLSPQERERALGISRGLKAAAASGERDAKQLAEIARRHMDGLDVEYVAVVHPDSFEPITAVNGRALIAVAARAGATRLIDNIEVTS
jgi:pantoate--beta-alanine ligase